MLQNIVGGD